MKISEFKILENYRKKKKKSIEKLESIRKYYKRIYENFDTISSRKEN